MNTSAPAPMMATLATQRARSLSALLPAAEALFGLAQRVQEQPGDPEVVSSSLAQAARLDEARSHGSVALATVG